MSEAKDPERLLADALRAQARSAPAADPVPKKSAPKKPETPEAPPPRYGLLSGAGSLERERPALEPPVTPPPVTPPLVTPPLAVPPPTVRPQATPRPDTGPKWGARGLPGYWILLLAVLLGLATGSVIGLITLL